MLCSAEIIPINDNTSVPAVFEEWYCFGFMEIGLYVNYLYLQEK